MEDEKIISKVRKLLTLSRDNANLNEALAAAEMAQSIMDKYKISHDTINGENYPEIIDYRIKYKSQFTPVRNPENWVSALMNVVANHNDCRVYIFTGFNDLEGAYKAFSIVGREEDIEFVKDMFHWLLIEVCRIGNREVHNQDQIENPNQWLADFHLGAIKQLEQKFKVMKDHSLEGLPQNQVQCAIIAINNRQKEINRIVDEMTVKFRKTQGNNYEAYIKGFKAAKEINVVKNGRLKDKG